MDLFKKKLTVGVSITPEVGLEVAMIDTETNTVLKYGVRQIDYNNNSRSIADLDIFKEALQDLFIDLDIPKNAEVVLNIPAVVFQTAEFPAAYESAQIESIVQDELAEHYIFKDNEPDISISILPSQSMQQNKVVYTAAQKAVIMEIVLIIKELGYKVYAIDTSVNSLLNALIYKDRLNVQPGTLWVLVIVESYCCRVISMLGQDYVDVFEERISIGEVLGDAENYSTVLSAISPIIKNLPSKYLCVVSKTNVISAEILAGKITYAAPIIHQEANVFSKEVLMELGSDVDPDFSKTITFDIIGACIYRDFEKVSNVHLNLYNKSLGDIYFSDQPPEINISGRRIVLSNEFLIKALIVFALILLVPIVITLLITLPAISADKHKLSDLEGQISQINNFLKENESISSDLFDEGYEIKIGIDHNKDIYTYYTIVGTEIPQKLWLTHLKLSDKMTIEGQADNLESIYAFFRNIKDYKPDSDIKLQKLGLATKASSILESGSNGFDMDSILTSLNSDYYEFRISNEAEVALSKEEDATDNSKSVKPSKLPALEPIKETN